MRLSGLTAVAAVVAPLSLTLTPTRALTQQPIRVLRHAPFDTIRSGNAITISFDRPVAGSIDRSANPETFVRLEPKFAAKIQWRDPATIRVIPNEPLPPGRRYRITVGKELVAMDGGRLEAPYQFTLQTRGPMLLGTVPALNVDRMAIPTLDPRANITLVYSAPVDSAELARVARLESRSVPGCPGAPIRFKPVRQRPVAESDGYTIRSWMYDANVDSQFVRVVELQPETPPPESCLTTLIIPTFDVLDRTEIYYRVMTASQFSVGSVRCQQDACYGQPLVLGFSAPVERSSLIGHVRIDPPVPFTIGEVDAPSATWYLHVQTKAKTTYRISLDSTIRDVFGRTLHGSREVIYAIGDRTPALGHQLGFFTVPRQRPVLRIWHVNTDSVEVAVVAIPDSLRTAVLVASQRLDSVVNLIATIRDTTRVKLALAAPRNEDHVIEFAIPSVMLRGDGPTPLIAMRARVFGHSAVMGVATPAAKGAVQKLPEVRITALGEIPTSFMALVQVTDLLAHARITDGAGAVLVTDMNTGAPRSRARVVLRDAHGRAIAAGSTDASGVANLTPDLGWKRPVDPYDDDSDWFSYGYSAGNRVHTSFIDVSLGSDRSATPAAPTGYEPWFSGDRRSFDPELIRALVYPDRAIYRPAEKIYLGMIVRRGTLDNLRPLEPRDSVRVRLALLGDGGGAELVRDTVVRLNAFGTAVDSFVTSPSVPLGEYQVRLDVMRDNAWRARTFTTLRIAEYRAPQFKAAIAIDSAIRFVGDSVPVRVSGSYYFGAPMPKAVMHWATSSEPADNVVIPGLPRTFIVAQTPWFDGSNRQSGALLSGVDTLDGSGNRSMVLPTSGGSLLGPAVMTFSASIEDVDRQTVTAIRSTLMHSSEFYIAARESGRSWYWRQDEPKTIEVLAVRPDGRHVTAARLGVTVIRHHGAYIRVNGAPTGAWRWVSDTVSRDSVTTADSIVRFRFSPARDGWYAVLFTATDPAGRPMATSVNGYVLPARWYGGWGLDPSGIAMKLARDTVAPGDSAVVSFISPFPHAEAWVTVEREGVIEQRRTRVRQGENAIAFRVDRTAIPSATVTLLLVDAAPAWKTDSLARRIRTATAKLVVDRSSKEIQVALTPRETRYAPGDSVCVRIQLKDYRGRPLVAQVSLWAVDESILALTDSTRLSVLDSMYVDRRSRLRFRSTAATLASLGIQLRPSAWFISMSRVAMLSTALQSEAVVVSRNAAAVAEFVPRKDFRSTAFYLASLVTDANGIVTATAKLPDNLTTYRLIAVAVDSADRFGGAESALMVTKPLLARSALPRFLRSGDEFHAGAVITNQTGGDISAAVTASATRTSLLGNSTRTLPLANGRTTEVRYDWKTSSNPGDTAVFTFGVSNAPYVDAVEAALPVKPPYSPRFHAISGVARGTQSVRMMLPPDIDPARSKVTLRVGNLPIPTIKAAYDMFQWYPYQCTEQLTSSGRTILALLRLKQAGIVDSLEAPSSTLLRARLQGVVDELSRRQSGEGGIGYWSSSSWTTTPLTSEAGRLLLGAREMGVKVRPKVLEVLTKYLTDQLERFSADSTYGTRRERERRTASLLGRKLAALHYLRDVGEPDEDAEDELLEQQRSMVWQDRVWLAELLALRGDLEDARTLLTSVWRDVEIGGTRVIVPDSLYDTYGFRSHVRPAARLLAATLAINSTDARLFPLVETVVQQTSRTHGWEWNTQDYVAAAETMSRVAMWMRTGRSTDSIVVRSLTKASTVLVAAPDGASTTAALTLDGLTQRDGAWTVLPLEIRAGKGTKFYTLTVDEVPRTPPTTPDAKGIIVERWYERFDDGRPVTEVREGELVRVRLRVTVPADREFVAVADPLPAGLEVVDLSLRTSSTLGPFESTESRAAEQAGNELNQDESLMYGRWWGGWWSPWEHTEQRDDRVVYFARWLWKGSYTAQYVARATTVGTFTKPPAHAEEMYNQSLGGRSDGGIFRVLRK